MTAQIELWFLKSIVQPGRNGGLTKRVVTPRGDGALAPDSFKLRLVDTRCLNMRTKAINCQ